LNGPGAHDEILAGSHDLRGGKLEAIEQLQRTVDILRSTERIHTRRFVQVAHRKVPA
jgi:hypothetical protein